MNLIALAEALAKAGATPDMIVAALKSQERDIEEKRASARERQRSSRYNKTIPVTVTSCDSQTEESENDFPPNPLTNPSKEKPPKGGKKKSPPCGERLTINTLPAEWEEFCRKERPDLVPAVIFSKFHDHWIAKPGKEGRKLDWFATWRNWCRNQYNKSPPSLQKPQKTNAIRI